MTMPFWDSGGSDSAVNGSAGLLYGNSHQFWIQIVAVLATLIYCAIATGVILLVLKAVMGLRAEDEAELTGLDSSIHGEKAYNLEE